MAFFKDENLRDVIANRPVTGPTIGAMFEASDTGAAYRWNGSSWDLWTANDLTSYAANLVVATPDGTSGPQGRRALVPNDIPALAESKVTNLVSDLALKAPLASPALTGTPTAPTPSTADSSTKIATTQWVRDQGYGGGSVFSWTAQTSYAAVHNFGTKNLIIGVYDDGSPRTQVLPTVDLTDDNTVTLGFGAAFTGHAVIAAFGTASSSSAVLFADSETPTPAADDSTVAFTLANTPNPGTSLQFFINGALQIPGTDYTLSGATITCTNAPATGDILTAFYRH